ncbi:ATP-binding protein [Coxiella endosymbiont of Ornithodoros amblus]|nr:ATP-binding protein [Coxiella endosymbiont of Ornithodoros amblus]
MGLGLRIVKQFIHEMEWEIDLISEYEKGTQFICTIHFKLPLSDDFVES